jgi:UDP-2,3-diacylglucosamine pyrophosphatase LpxH
MKILFLSDLHLGSPLFDSEGEILNILQRYYDMVVVLGDFIDVWEDNFDHTVLKYHMIMNALISLGNRLIVVRGNHDPETHKFDILFPSAIVSESFDFSYDSEVFRIIHGHEFDIMVKDYSWLMRAVFPIQWFLERMGVNLKGFLRKFFYSVSAKFNNKGYFELVSKIEKEAVKKYNTEYDALVMGHTHFPKIVEEQGFKYINTGDWINNKTYVIFEDGNFSLMGDINNDLV